MRIVLRMQHEHEGLRLYVGDLRDLRCKEKPSQHAKAAAHCQQVRNVLLAVRSNIIDTGRDVGPSRLRRPAKVRSVEGQPGETCFCLSGVRRSPTSKTIAQEAA